MKLLHGVVCLVFLGLAACASVGPASSGASSPSKAKKESIVPLPKRTPFDGDPAARAAYLESFGHGYRIGLAGYSASYHMTYTTHLRAHSEGYFAGQSAGAADHEAKAMEEPIKSPTAQRP